ncbi:hypothetical protein CQ12_30230 [Bradyrhizobium jicamae]|uniref:Uncharacterized protein n=1 Tax=Bradyrhizobium jicamae TaxID=280332 RepID=A0A0R3KHH8_9BRAD|nr:hypothetical protein [Bradyrhizobium jicamae]KRQ95217.1 hypothetical protein CQ12_30230 [Bradyrhizobium jicamae]
MLTPPPAEFAGWHSRFSAGCSANYIGVARGPAMGIASLHHPAKSDALAQLKSKHPELLPHDDSRGHSGVLTVVLRFANRARADSIVDATCILQALLPPYRAKRLGLHRIFTG